METQERDYQEAKGFLEESWMECMISSLMKEQFDSVLREQHLADVASNFAPDFFDEIPLYSRYEQVDFLKEYGDVNLLLVELALEYLGRVTTELRVGRTKRFVAISIISDDDDEYLVPYIFVCNGNVKERLKELHLSSPSAGLGSRIESLVKKAGLDTTFCVLEDRSTIPGDVRVFVGYRSPAHGLMNLECFTNRTPADNARRQKLTSQHPTRR